MSTTFISKAAEFQCVLKQGKRIYEGQEQVGWTDPGIAEFKRGIFIANDTSAQALGFGGEAELVEALRNRKATVNQEFWEMGNEPDAMHPAVDILLGKISDYAVDHNVDGLREILAQEQDTHNRHEVLVSAQRALGRLGDTVVGKRGPGRVPKVAA